MPFTFPELFALLVGLIEILLAAASDFVGNLISKLLPDIPVVGNALRNAVIDLWNHTVGGWLIDKASGDTGAARTLTNHTAGTSKAIDATRGVASHLGDQVAQLHNTTIPAAASSAVSAARTYTDQQTAPLSDRIGNLTTEANNIAGSVTNLTNYLNGQFRSAIDADIRSSVDNGVVAAEQQANADVAALAAQITQALQAIWGQVDNLDVLATQTLPAETTQVANAAAAARLAMQQADAAQLTSDVATLQNEITQAEAAGQAATADALRTAQASAAAQAATLQGEITVQQGNVGTLRQDLSTVITPAIAAVAASVAAITTEYQNCAVTTCDGPNNWQNLLGSLAQGATLAELIAFLAEAAKDPGGEAQALAGVGADLYHTGHSLIDGLLSL